MKDSARMGIGDANGSLAPAKRMAGRTPLFIGPVYYGRAILTEDAHAK